MALKEGGTMADKKKVLVVGEGKSPAMMSFLKDFHKKTFGTNYGDASRCSHCNGEIGSFRDAESEKEFTISGMCQKCQDEIW